MSISLISSRSLRQSFLGGCPILECSLHSGKNPQFVQLVWLIDWLIHLVTLALGRNEHLHTIFSVLVTWPFDRPAHIRIAIHDYPLIFPIYQFLWYNYAIAYFTLVGSPIEFLLSFFLCLIPLLSFSFVLCSFDVLTCSVPQPLSNLEYGDPLTLNRWR